MTIFNIDSGLVTSVIDGATVETGGFYFLTSDLEVFETSDGDLLQVNE